MVDNNNGWYCHHVPLFFETMGDAILEMLSLTISVLRYHSQVLSDYCSLVDLESRYKADYYNMILDMEQQWNEIL